MKSTKRAPAPSLLTVVRAHCTFHLKNRSLIWRSVIGQTSLSSRCHFPRFEMDSSSSSNL